MTSSSSGDSTLEASLDLLMQAQLRSRAATAAKSPVKAGGVVVREGKRGREVLLVTSRSRPGRWIFPKGTAERGETHDVTAEREIREEAGVKAALLEKLGVVKRSTQTITFFLFRWESDVGWTEHTIRERRWVRFDDVERYLRQTDLHAIVERARKVVGRT